MQRSGHNVETPSGAQSSPMDVQPGHQSAHSQGRLGRYDEYRRVYLGEQWLGAPAPGERRITWNYARVFVNKAASYLLSKPVGYNAVPMVEAEARGQYLGTGVAERLEVGREAARQVEEYLGEVAAFNDLAAQDLDMAIMSGTLGDGAFTVRWDDTEKMPRVTGVDPSSLDARWRADDLRALLWVRQSYWITPGELTEEQRGKLAGRSQWLATGADMYEPMRAQEEWTARAWKLTVGDVEVGGGVNPYGVIPYVIYPNLRVPGEFWGEGDLVDLVEIQRELNTRVSVFSRILEVAGNPVAVIEGADEESTKTLKLGPNQLWTLPVGAKAEVLDLLKAGGADAHLKYIDALYRAMHDITEMPRTSFGDSSGEAQARSGVALEIELQPLFHKLARKQAILGSAFVRRSQLIMRMARLHGVQLPEVSLSTTWPPVLPQDREALVKQEVALVGAGIHPPTKAISMLGSADPQPLFELVLSEGQRLMEAGLLKGHNTVGGAPAANAANVVQPAQDEKGGTTDKRAAAVGAKAVEGTAGSGT